MRVAANQLQGNAETYQLDIASNQQDFSTFTWWPIGSCPNPLTTAFDVQVCPWRHHALCSVVNEQNSGRTKMMLWDSHCSYHWFTNIKTILPKEDPLFAGLVAEFRPSDLGRVEDLRGRRGRRHRIISYITISTWNTSKTAGTSHVPKSWASLLFKTSFQHVHDATFSNFYGSTLYQVSNYYHCLANAEARMGNKWNPPVGLMVSGFPSPVAFFRSIRKGIQHGRAGHARRKAA